ncbi:hypothetical protein ACWGID_18165 [Kribbella sp. NPDC054772]
MTAERLDLHRPVRKPAGNLFRVTAAVSVLSLPLLLAADLWLPLPDYDVCYDDEPCPSLDTITGSSTAWILLLITAGTQLVILGCYIAVALRRRTLDLPAVRRWLPTAIAVIALALGGLGWLISAIGLNPKPGQVVTYLVLLALWLLAPLVLYDVQRGDPRAVIPVTLALLPTVGLTTISALDFGAFAALPVVMLLIALATVVIARRRQ